MQANIIPENIVFNNCYSGTEFENKTVDFLRLAGLTANRVGKANDGGIDIEASVNIQGVKYSYYIQCKYYNKPLGKGPIQEVYSGAAFYNNIGKPVVITNNEVTFNARTYAKKLGVNGKIKYTNWGCGHLLGPKSLSNAISNQRKSLNLPASTSIFNVGTNASFSTMEMLAVVSM